MSVLIGHPGGNPNSHHAALAYWERDRLAAFCVPWMPTPTQMRLLRAVPGLHGHAARLSRRSFGPLLDAPRIEGKAFEWLRLARRLSSGARYRDERLSYEANDWLMNTMRRHVSEPNVSAIHAYEDCALWSFEEARRLGKPCIYDMPIGYYPAWQELQQTLLRRYADWLPPSGMQESRFVRPQQKVAEMELADLVLVPSRFVQRTIQQYTDKEVRLAPYGVDLERWRPAERPTPRESSPLRFLFAGHISVRKGLPLLFDAWRQAGLRDAQLKLVGSWHLSQRALHELPSNVSYLGHRSPSGLRQAYQEADVFVFPSYFDGYGLVILEAMACGLPVVASDAGGAADFVDQDCGRIFPAGDIGTLVEQLRELAERRDELGQMQRASRLKAEQMTWENYRQCVSQAVEPLLGVSG